MGDQADGSKHCSHKDKELEYGVQFLTCRIPPKRNPGKGIYFVIQGNNHRIGLPPVQGRAFLPLLFGMFIEIVSINTFRVP